jgi:NAD(P)-dependent dehydrogenase (short-subunit alcohol dehydrogenase family)
MSEDFADRHVVVTGAGGGLGPAVVACLVGAGATCHLPQRRQSPAGAGQPESGPRIHTVGGVDLGDDEAVRRFYAELPPLWASVHVAGGYAGGPFLDTSLAALSQQLDLNLKTAFLCCREAVRNMRLAGTGGRVLNLTSRAAEEPAGGAIAYAISKAGVAMLTRTLAKEVAPDGILVNAVAPSIIDTPANRAAMPRADFGLWPSPTDVAETIAWLVSPRNRLTTGTVVPVYGRA